MILASYLALIGVMCAISLVDWRRGWMFVALCGVIQDPVRKMTANTPVWVSFLVVLVYGCVIISARNEMLADVKDFARRFPDIYTAAFIFLCLLVISALNGVFTYGFDKWKVPLLSFVTYVVPGIAILLGYSWFRREEQLYRYFKWYAALTSVALIGTVLEYLRVDSRLIGLVSFEGDYIRHLPGLQIRLLSGFYRSPDIMAWHAATLTVIGIVMALRSGIGKEVVIWSTVAGWGFLNSMITGRRKAVYYVVVFTLIFAWRYFRRIKASQVFALLGLAAIIAIVLHNIGSSSNASVYARGALASQDEIADRLEGGLMETFKEFGLMGAGLGAATQGVRHLLGTQAAVGWQEGGLGKLAIELGLPGILAIGLFGWIVAGLLLRLTKIGDVEGSTQFTRVVLFGLVVANLTNFTVSAQAYSDAVLSLTAGFFTGCLFASAALDERLGATATTRAAATAAQPVPAAVTVEQ